MRSMRIRLIIASLLLASLACNMPFQIQLPKSLIPWLLVSTPPGLEATLAPTTDGSGDNDNPTPDGELRFLTDETSIWTEGESWFKPVFGCWPSSYYDDGGGYLRVTAGILDGYCSWTSPSQVNTAVNWNTGGTLTGTHNLMTGEIQFTFNTSAHYPNNNNIKLEFIGTGEYTSMVLAEGNATFTATCNSIGEGENCTHTVDGQTIRRKSWQISGSVPWRMDFPP